MRERFASQNPTGNRGGSRDVFYQSADVHRQSRERDFSAQGGANKLFFAPLRVLGFHNPDRNVNAKRVGNLFNRLRNDLNSCRFVVFNTDVYGFRANCGSGENRSDDNRLRELEHEPIVGG